MSAIEATVDRLHAAEAEVERLNGMLDACTKNARIAWGQRNAYRAAIKDIMDRICIMGMADEDEQWFWDRLRKLPEG